MPPATPTPQGEDKNTLIRGVRLAVTVAVGAETRAALEMSRAGVLWGGCPRIPRGRTIFPFLFFNCDRITEKGSTWCSRVLNACPSPS